MGDKSFAVIAFVFIIAFAVYLVWTGSVNPAKVNKINWKAFFGGYNLFPTSSNPTYAPPAASPSPPQAPQKQEPQNSPTYLQGEIPPGYTQAQLSPYFHKVRLSSVFPGYFGSSYGQVSLYTSFSEQNQMVYVSGWILKANRGSQIIPRAVDVYEPHGLTPEGDIYLKNGDVLYIYTNSSPITKNLRLNKCLGYLENAISFTPSIPQTCPYITRQEVSSFTGQCQNYVLSLGSCRLPAANPPIPPDDYACRTFLDNLNYRGCFDRHRSDPDFLSKEWRVWTNSRFLDQQHDTLLLFDSQGLLVDLYSY